MIGIILWSDPSEKKAVIWCEDHGDLAFFSQTEPVRHVDEFVDVGDVVEFDLLTMRNTRKVENLKILSGARASSLVEELKTVQPEQSVPVHQTAEVIPFRLDAPTRRPSQVSTQVQRRG